MRYVILLLFSLNICASEMSKHINVDKLYLEAIKIQSVRDHRFPEDHQPKTSLNVGMDFSVKKRFFWKNRIVSAIDESQFRFVGWEFDLGAKIIDEVEIFYRHASYHVLDTYNPNTKYPVYNGIGIRLNLIY